MPMPDPAPARVRLTFTSQEDVLVLLLAKPLPAADIVRTLVARKIADATSLYRGLRSLHLHGFIAVDETPAAAQVDLARARASLLTIANDPEATGDRQAPQLRYQLTDAGRIYAGWVQDRRTLERAKAPRSLLERASRHLHQALLGSRKNGETVLSG